MSAPRDVNQLIADSNDFLSKFSLESLMESSENSESISTEIATAEEDELSQAATELVALIEANYNFSHELIDLPGLRENFLGDDAEFRVLIVEHINPRLLGRGLPLYVLDPIRPKLIKKPGEFEPTFILACNVIFDPSSSKSFTARMKDLEPLGITSKTWSAWMSEPKKFEYAQKLLDQKFDKEVDLHANMSIARNVLAGDLPSIKYYKELTGKFRPTSENSTNVAAIIMVILEILTKHVKPDVIEAVANELETSPVGELLAGRTVIG